MTQQSAKVKEFQGFSWLISRELQLILTTLRPSDQHLAAVYLAKLALGSQRARRQALDVVVGILTSGRCDAKALLDRQRAAV